jgi:hypothetical protein
VLFTRAADLVRQLIEASDARELPRLQQRLLRVGLGRPLAHHATALTTKGKSYRMRKRRTREEPS